MMLKKACVLYVVSLILLVGFVWSNSGTTDVVELEHFHFRINRVCINGRAEKARFVYFPGSFHLSNRHNQAVYSGYDFADGYGVFVFHADEVALFDFKAALKKSDADHKKVIKKQSEEMQAALRKGDSLAIIQTFEKNTYGSLKEFHIASLRLSDYYQPEHIYDYEKGRVEFDGIKVKGDLVTLDVYWYNRRFIFAYDLKKKQWRKIREEGFSN